jgi:hypothetical protein
MRVTIIRDDNTVVVDGERQTVDCSSLPADVHALQWDGARGEIEYAMVICAHCNGRSKKPNEIIFDVSPYQQLLHDWHAVKAKEAEAAAAKEAEAAAALEKANDAAG